MTNSDNGQISPKPAAFPVAVKPRRGKRMRRIIVVLLVVGLLGGGYLWRRGREVAPALAQDNFTEFTVARGNVTHTVSGPGAVSPVKIFTIATNLTGDILADYIEEGDEVEKDALLFLLDGETTSLNFDAAKDTLSNARDSYQSALRNKQELITYARQDGVVSALYVKKGDYVNSGGKVADIIDTGSMLLTLPFNSADAEQLREGEAAAVFLDDFGLILDGYVRKVMSGQSVSWTGALVTNVEIVFTNPGALSPGAFATAVAGEFACNDVGQISYAVEDTVYAAGSGKIIELTVSEGDNVGVGQKILALENSNVEDTLSRAAKSVGDAETKLTNTQNNLQIKSPIAGTVLDKSAKAGDTLYNTSTTLAVVADMSCLIFTIDVDELEIRYVQAGQQAVITADAYEGEIFSGIVTNVGKTGASSGGVTTYPVTIEIAEYGGLLPGMNVNADIVVREAVNVLYIPVDAVTRGNLVLVKDDGSGQQPLFDPAAGGESQWPTMRGEGEEGQWLQQRSDGEERQWPPARGEGEEGQWPPARGEGQEGQQPLTRGEGEEGQWPPQRGEGEEGQWPPQRGEGEEGQWPPARGEGQNGQQPLTRGEEQNGQQPLTRGEGQNGQQPLTRGEGQNGQPGDGQGSQRQRVSQGDGWGGNTTMGFMGAEAPEGYVYRLVETGISDSAYVEIISGLNEGDVIAYRPAVRNNNTMDFMFMGPGGGMRFPDSGMSGGTVIRQATPMPGGR